MVNGWLVGGLEHEWFIFHFIKKGCHPNPIDELSIIFQRALGQPPKNSLISDLDLPFHLPIFARSWCPYQEQSLMRRSLSSYKDLTSFDKALHQLRWGIGSRESPGPFFWKTNGEQPGPWNDRKIPAETWHMIFMIYFYTYLLIYIYIQIHLQLTHVAMNIAYPWRIAINKSISSTHIYIYIYTYTYIHYRT